VNAVDDRAVTQFRNFLSWGEKPLMAKATPPAKLSATRPVPPAWWAYALGATPYCPPVGVL
jgi:hypothetical protein